MATNRITLDLPDDLYEKLLRMADATRRSPEQVLKENLELLLQEPDPTIDLSEFEAYTDAQLWAVVYRRLPWAQTQRLNELLDRGQRGLLSDSERDEVVALSDLSETYMVQRSEALRLLHERGHDINQFRQRAV